MTATRRNFLRSAPAALALVGLPAAAIAALPRPFADAKLIALGEELKAGLEGEREADAQNGILCAAGDYEEADRVSEVACEVSHRIVSRIEITPATTLAGLKVKALAVAWCHAGFDCIDFEATTTDLRLAQQIVVALASGEVR